MNRSVLRCLQRLVDVGNDVRDVLEELVACESNFDRLEPWHMAYGVLLMVPDHVPYAISHKRYD
jgi:hypothetical protein